MRSHRLQRRELLALLGGAVMAPPAPVHAQGARVRRIAVLQGLPENDPEGRSEIAALRKGLQDHGWMEGHNLRVDYRWPGGDVERARIFAKEVVASSPDVIVSRSTPATRALLDESRAIPIVFVQVADPISSGFVASLARPGGNVTGFTNVEASMGGKWVELLKDMAPTTTRAAFMFNPATAPYSPSFLRTAQQAASALGIELLETRVRSNADIESALEALAGRAGGGIVAIPDTFLVEHRQVVIELAARFRLPAVYANRVFAPSGGLMHYAVDTLDIFRRSAGYVDRILKGDKPADLPVQQPVRYELIINLKTARALAIDVPPLMLVRADGVIE